MVPIQLDVKYAAGRAALKLADPAARSAISAMNTTLAEMQNLRRPLEDVLGSANDGDAEGLAAAEAEVVRTAYELRNVLVRVGASLEEIGGLMVQAGPILDSIIGEYQPPAPEEPDVTAGGGE